jgi:hypothetical protein
LAKDYSNEKKYINQNIPPMPMSARSHSVNNFNKKVPV